jgi:hypothetical protein
MTIGEHTVKGLHDFDGRWCPPWWRPAPKAEIARKKNVTRESLLSKMASVHSTLAATPSKLWHQQLKPTLTLTFFSVLDGVRHGGRPCWQRRLSLSRNRGALVSCLASAVVGMCSWCEHPLRTRQQESILQIIDFLSLPGAAGKCNFSSFFGAPAAKNNERSIL